jgi:ribosomal protein L11 methyltransferase
MKRQRLYLWRRLVESGKIEVRQNELPPSARSQAAVITRPDRKRALLEVACKSRRDALKLMRKFGGRIVTLAPGWYERFAHAKKARPLQLGGRLLVIPAGAAFGTGEHPTTAMSLRLLEQLTKFWGTPSSRVLFSAPSPKSFCGRKSCASSLCIPRGRGMRHAGRVRSPELVVDIGTGSGILALAAKCLGAKRVMGIDIDPMAISTARKNARRNRIDRVRFQIADARYWKFPRKIDIVTANLFSELLIEILPKLKRSRWLILSGILREHEPEFVRTLKRHKINILKVRRLGKWVTMVAAS